MTPETHEESLDPNDWSELRNLGHQMVDDMMNYFSSLRERPVWQPMPDEVRGSFKLPVPSEGEGFEKAYRDFKDNVLPYPNGNIHPRFWGWVQGTGTPFAMLADMLASGMNPHMAGFDQAPVEVEKVVIDWLKKLLGFPESASGLLTSGATMANLIGIAVARNSVCGADFRKSGFNNEEARGLVVYASAETHSWARKTLELLGFGNERLRLIETNQAYQISLEALSEAIVQDRRAGLKPFVVIANVGTVNTGAIDDLQSLSKLTREEGLWLHADGAFGALAKLSPKYRHLVSGLELVDSIAFDLHKWMYLPFEAGCVVINRPDEQAKTFSSTAPYLSSAGRGVCSGPLVFADLGIELTRSFKALKIWMSLKAHGANLFGRLIGQNIDQARYLAGRIEESACLQLMAPVNLNVVCFRFRKPGLSAEELDQLNEEILLRLQVSGVAVPSGTRISRAFVLRVANVNQRSKSSDFDFLKGETERLGTQILSEWQGQ